MIIDMGKKRMNEILKLFGGVTSAGMREKSTPDTTKVESVIVVGHIESPGKAIEFDKLHHPEVMNGGLWMNSGFSIDRGLGDWELVPCKVTYLTPVATGG